MTTICDLQRWNLISVHKSHNRATRNTYFEQIWIPSYNLTQSELSEFLTAAALHCYILLTWRWTHSISQSLLHHYRSNRNVHSVVLNLFRQVLPSVLFRSNAPLLIKTLKYRSISMSIRKMTKTTIPSIYIPATMELLRKNGQSVLFSF